MILILNLPPAVEDKLIERAGREGRPVEEVAMSAVEQFLLAGESDASSRRSV